MSDGRQLFSTLEVEGGLALVGELDAATVPALNAALSALNGRSDVTLDLSRLTFMDSSGMHAIATFARSRGPDGVVTLTRPSRFLVRMLEITRMGELPNLRIDG